MHPLSKRWLLAVPFLAALLVAVTATHRQGALAAGSVSIHDFSFDPATITITAGDSVTWTNNQSGVPHTVTADDSSFDAGRLNTGQTFTMTFPRAGTFAYHCEIHHSMHGTVQVNAASTAPGGAGSTGAAAAGPSSRTYPGGFNLIGVPAGTSLNASAVYAFDSASNNYRAVGPDEQLLGGAGYWAFFDGSTTVPLPTGSNAPVSTPAAPGAWTLIGNPSGTMPALVTGADAVYTFDAAGGSYRATMTLQPGDGAWALSQKGGAITVSPGATPTPSPTPSPSPTPVPAMQQPTQQPVQQVTPAPTRTATPAPYYY